MQENSYKSFLRNYYLMGFFHEFIFAYAIYTLLFSVRGLSILQISLLLSIWAIAAAVLEIPTGALADSWSRKKMLTLAPLIKASCFFTWIFAGGNFYLYALGFLFWSLSGAFNSGTREALLYDTMFHFGKTEEYEKVLGRVQSYILVATALSVIGGGFIAAYRLEFALLFSIVPLLLATYFASRLYEAPKIESTGEVCYLEYIKIAFQEVKENRILLYLFIFLYGICMFGELEEFEQLYYQLAKLPLFAFGLAGGLGMMLRALGTYYAHKLRGKTLVFYIIPFICGVSLFFVARYPDIPMIVLYNIAYAITAPLIVLTESRIQHTIKSTSRATVTSIGSLLMNLPVLTLIMGVVGNIWEVQGIFYAHAILFFMLTAWVCMMGCKFLRQPVK